MDCDEECGCEEFDEEEDLEEAFQRTEYLKYLFSGIESIGELSAAFITFGEYLKTEEDRGNELEDPVDGAWVRFKLPLLKNTEATND